MVLVFTSSYELVKDYLHPNIHNFINHYRDGNLIDLPQFHGCGLVNRNGSRKFVRYEFGELCVAPTWRRYWRKTKPKHKTKIRFCYWVPFITQTRDSYLFKNKCYFVYNYKLKKYEHMNNTPMHNHFKEMQKFKQHLWKNVLA